MIFYFIAIGLIIGMLVVIFSIYFSIVRSRAAEHRHNIHERFHPERDIIMQATALCTGQTTHTSGIALHGRGILFLTKDELHFEMSIPSVAWHIPVKSISKVVATSKELQVTYTSKHGHEKEIRWQVPQKKRWLTALKQVTVSAVPTTTPPLQ